MPKTSLIQSYLDLMPPLVQSPHFWSLTLLVVVSAGASLLVMALGMPRYIHWLQQQAYGQYIREDGPQNHLRKAGTPTMGGVMICVAILIGLFLAWGIFTVLGKLDLPVLNALPLSALSKHLGGKTLVSSGLPVLGIAAFVLLLLGFEDDFQKVNKQHNKGVTGYTKLVIQGLSGLILGLVLYENGHSMVQLTPMWSLDLGFLYPFYGAFAVAAVSNAVNLTDGLDGLAANTLSASFMGVLLLASVMWLYGNSSAEALWWIMALAVIVGALRGFWLFNRHPAKVFMGDTGSLTLGGLLAGFCLWLRLDSLLLLLGFIFLIETLSVMIQVTSFKTTGRRVFKMSPLHHHFELCGMHEQTVAGWFTGIHSVACLLAVVLWSLG